MTDPTSTGDDIAVHDPGSEIQTGSTSQTLPGPSIPPDVGWFGEGIQNEPVEEQLTPESAWNKKNILSLDAGGTRGLWTLLALEKLMEFIAVEEQRLINHNSDSHIICSSFLPLDFPDALLNSSEGVGPGSWRKYNEDLRCCPCPSTRRYLPCHYFDYICGSSTGALIAIMLGRLRMNVPDCIFEYQKLGGRVFGHPRKIISMVLHVKRNRYSAKNFESVINELVDQRNEQDAGSGDFKGASEFEVKKGVCKIFVTAYAKDADSDLGEDLWLIRSYDVPKTTNTREFSKRQTTTGTTASHPAPSHRATGVTGRTPTGTSSHVRRTRQLVYRKINRGRASNLPIWQVARAASAARFHFKPMKVQKAEGGYMYFTDGGVGPQNNPTHEAISEVAELDEAQNINTVVSIGTARKGGHVDAEKPGYFSQGKAIFNKGTDPEAVHRTVTQLSGMDEFNFDYFRFNDPEKLDIRFDEWKPRIGKNSGKDTIGPD